ncbi:MAG: stage III sporulation protein AE [Defluviitaleaceae bacterium]|nr:stage III sporulation protein AE [Defluviitaleaceae bacterium]
MNDLNFADEIVEMIGFEKYDIGILNSSRANFSDLVRDAIAGQIDFSLRGIFFSFGEIFFAEFISNGQLLRQLIIIAILGALMSCLTEAFKNKSAAETGFFVTYLMAVSLAVSSFFIVAEILNSLVSLVSAVMFAAIPLMVALMAMSGNFVGAAGFHPTPFFGLQLLAWFISAIFVPIVLASAGFDIAGQISPDGHKLKKLSELLQKIAAWSLKGSLAAFAFLLTLQKFSAPIIGNIALKTSRSVVGAVPVVGSAFTAAVDTVVNFSQAARSGVMVALVIVLCVAIAAPLLKIFVFSFVYRLTAAFLQPVADARLVALMDGAGKTMAMLFNAAALIGVVCIFTVVILLSF